jgi:predicted nucleic acid-binding protein
MTYAYADTSFLASLYLRDTNLAAARNFLIAHQSPLTFTSLQRFELRNAIRLSVNRGKVSEVAASKAFSEIDRDVAAGNLSEAGLVWPEVLEFAEEIGAAHSAALGVRSLDLLHVAAAASLDTKVFLTLDTRQHVVAKAAGMRVGP